MKIVADENIPFAQEAFGSLGQVTVLPGRDISRQSLQNAQMLCVRSVTQVDAALLAKTDVRYVASATIGTDHLDTDYLEDAGIQYCNAPGSNAASVGDYVTAALLEVALKQGESLANKKLGIIGCGHVGGCVAQRAAALGMQVLENDPPLARKTNDPRYLPLEEIFQADYITLHVPLTRQGQDATFHLVDAGFFNKMQQHAVLLNTSRGAVVDGDALKSTLNKGHIAEAVLDVWENEPTIDPKLVQKTAISTPHIAGYAYDGKIRGVVQIYQQICKWLDKAASWQPQTPEQPKIEIAASGRTNEDVLREAARAVYAVMEDDAALRRVVMQTDASERGRGFDQLRKDYPKRREFAQIAIRLIEGSSQLTEKLRGLSFQVTESEPE